MREIIIRTILCSAFAFTNLIIGCSDNKATVALARSNYEKNEKVVHALVDYFKSISPDSQGVLLGLTDSRSTYRIGLFNYTHAIIEGDPNRGGELDIDSEEMAMYLEELGWSKENVLEIEKMLNEADCISISIDAEDVEVRYRTSDVSSVVYLIQSTPMSQGLMDSLRSTNPDNVINEYVYIGFTSAL